MCWGQTWRLLSHFFLLHPFPTQKSRTPGSCKVVQDVFLGKPIPEIIHSGKKYLRHQGPRSNKQIKILALAVLTSFGGGRCYPRLLVSASPREGPAP